MTGVVARTLDFTFNVTKLPEWARLNGVQDSSIVDPAEEEQSSARSDEGQEELVETVESQKAKSAENIEKLQSVVLEQQHVHDRVIAKIWCGEQIPITEQRDEAQDAARHRNVNSSYSSEEPFLSSDLHQVRQCNAQHMAVHFQNDKDRTETLHRRRRQFMQEAVQYNEHLKYKFDKIDKTARLRQHELTERQAEKTMVAQQRRGEQQRIMQEIKKAEDHKFEKLQLKHHPEAVSTLKHKGYSDIEVESASQSRPSTSPTTAELNQIKAWEKEGSVDEMEWLTPWTDSWRTETTETKALPKPSSAVTGERVYRKMAESRKLYDNTLDKYSKFVTENEKRAEAYWCKRLDGERKLLRRGTSKVSLGHFKKTASETSPMKKHLAAEKTEAEIAVDINWKAEGFTESQGNSPSSPSRQALNRGITSATRIAFSDVHAARLEQVKSHHHELEQKAAEKLKRDQEYLEEKRQMQKNELNRKVNRAQDYNTAWAQRNESTAQRRSEMNQTSDTDVMQKMANARKKEAETQEKRAEELRIQAAKNEAKRQVTQDMNTMKWDQKVSRFMEKSDEREDNASSWLRTRLGTASERSDLGTAEREKAQAMVKAKKANELEFRKQASAEISKKEARIEHAKLFAKKPSTPAQAFERHRAVKQMGCSMPRDRSSELTISPVGLSQLKGKVSLEDLSTEEAALSASVKCLPAPVHRVKRAHSMMHHHGGQHRGSTCEAGEDDEADEADFISDLKNWADAKLSVTRDETGRVS